MNAQFVNKVKAYFDAYNAYAESAGTKPHLFEQANQLEAEILEEIEAFNNPATEIPSVLPDGNIVQTSHFELRTSIGGQHYFVLIAENGKEVGGSVAAEYYVSEYNARRGISDMVAIIRSFNQFIPVIRKTN